jgi:uncharacterized membrane protein
MKRTVTIFLSAAALSLGGCASMDDDRLGDTATGAGVGAAAGAGLGAVVGGISPIEGAVIGAAVGGVAGAVWSDRDNDGYADGYVREGQYYQGRPDYSMSQPRDCRSVLGSAATGAGVGALGGAGLGAVVGGINPLEGALIGAAVGGIGGAVWADRNNDGCADGYVREGQYYEGAPMSQPSYGGNRAGERG